MAIRTLGPTISKYASPLSSRTLDLQMPGDPQSFSNSVYSKLNLVSFLWIVLFLLITSTTIHTDLPYASLSLMLHLLGGQRPPHKTVNTEPGAKHIFNKPYIPSSSSNHHHNFSQVKEIVLVHGYRQPLLTYLKCQNIT